MTYIQLISSVPVTRSQDLAFKGSGQLVSDKHCRLVLNGKHTRFTQQVFSRDTLVVSKTNSFQVSQVISDTELRLTETLTDEAIDRINKSEAYKIIPHVNQSRLYEKVHERLNSGVCLVIFPEGGSHDRSEMLPLKGKRVMIYIICDF